MKIRAVGFLYIFIISFFALACEEADLTGVESGDVQGLWQNRTGTGNNTFLLVSDTEFNFYYYNASENCITAEVYIVVDNSDAGIYVLKKNEDDEENVVYTLAINGTRLHVRNIEDTQDNIRYFFASEVDLETLAPTCFNEEVLGIWKLDSTEIDEYMHISTEEVESKTFDETEQCFVTVGYDVVSIENQTFYLQEQITDPDQFEADFELVEEGLNVTWKYAIGDESEVYVATDSVFSELMPVCALR